MTREEILSVAARVVHHAEGLPLTLVKSGDDLISLTFEDLRAIVVCALREFEEDGIASR